MNNLSINPSSVVYATGANFPDALSGSALAGINKTVLLLAQNESSPTVGASSILPDVESVYVLGGQNAIGPATFNAISSSFGLSDREYVLSQRLRRSPNRMIRFMVLIKQVNSVKNLI